MIILPQKELLSRISHETQDYNIAYTVAAPHGSIRECCADQRITSASSR